MSFWQKQDGSAVENTTSFEMGGGDIKPIPNNTALIAAIEEAKWAEYDGEHYINLKWRVMRPADYANRVIFQKLHVFDPKKGDKAKQMLAAIDANCGGKLARLNDAPEDHDLMTALIGKPMAAKVQVWEINGKTGNWISAVSPAKPQAPVQAQPQTQPRQPAQNAHNQAKSNAYQPQNNVIDDEDDIPF
ncbi:hypothetical protein [uncultured Agitococcus sp.]|uniref:hypothetical protein n=1 Tax=uncultured Agitococcus sp. TaxID=1506599 RepID=UPI00262B4735|nr:hypothetical protein [uncultured Agitococcus sp.]